MLPPMESRRALLRLFRKRLVVTLDPLLETLRTRARMSVFRRLSSMGYLTSYSHAGRYYTLRDIPEFDEQGLWQHLGVSFSRHGSLKNTAEHIVNDSEAGQTHPELEFILGVRVHNTLLDLVEEERIGRVPLARYFLYVSRKRRIANAQIKRRREELKREATVPEGKPATEVVIEVLLELIHGAKVQAEPSAIAARLAARGIRVSATQVRAILDEHGLKKTAKFRSRRSQR
ncbi:MAG TPA: hypothetical protein VEK15_27100 [Vicinamibacteria bacterium]|nr:hypothetical protein [Vicinamibacteria bacterium]